MLTTHYSLLNYHYSLLATLATYCLPGECHQVVRLSSEDQWQGHQHVVGCPVERLPGRHGPPRHGHSPRRLLPHPHLHDHTAQHHVAAAHPRRPLRDPRLDTARNVPLDAVRPGYSYLLALLLAHSTEDLSEVLYSQKTVSIFEMPGLFLILCIGADDIFVFTDTWKVSELVGKLVF